MDQGNRWIGELYCDGNGGHIRNGTFYPTGIGHFHPTENGRFHPTLTSDARRTDGIANAANASSVTDGIANVANARFATHDIANVANATNKKQKQIQIQNQTQKTDPLFERLRPDEAMTAKMIAGIVAWKKTDPRLEALLEMRYLCYKDWPEIMAAMHCSNTTIHKMHRDALNPKIEENKKRQ